MAPDPDAKSEAYGAKLRPSLLHRVEALRMTLGVSKGAMVEAGLVMLLEAHGAPGMTPWQAGRHCVPKPRWGFDDP